MKSVVYTVLLLAVASIATGSQDIYYQNLPKYTPANLTMTVRVLPGGAMESAQKTCNATLVGSACLPQASYDNDDAIYVKWSFPGPVESFKTYQHKNATSIQLKACFQNDSKLNRGWRKAKPTAPIWKHKDCPKTLKDKLPLTGGEVTWKVPSDVPYAVNYVRLFVMCGEGSEDYCAYYNGTQAGYYQTNVIDSVTPAILATAIFCSILQPSILVAYFVRAHYTKNK